MELDTYVQCGPNAWYTPNPKQCAALLGDKYWFCHNKGGVAWAVLQGSAFDYALLAARNVFDTEGEALAAIRAPISGDPLTWDEIKKYDPAYIVYYVSAYDENVGIYSITVGTWIRNGRLAFLSKQPVWRSEEAAKAWIRKQEENKNG